MWTAYHLPFRFFWNSMQFEQYHIILILIHFYTNNIFSNSDAFFTLLIEVSFWFNGGT